MADADGKYFNLARVKGELEIPSTDEVDDAYLKLRGKEQDLLIDNDLAGFLELIPVADTNVTEDLTLASIYGISRRYKIKNKSFESAKSYSELYDATINSIKNKLKAIPTTHTRRVSVSKSYRTEPQLSDP